VLHSIPLINVEGNVCSCSFSVSDWIYIYIYLSSLFKIQIAAVLKLSANGGRFGKLRQDDITPWRSKQTTAAANDTTTQDPSQNASNGTQSSQDPSQNTKNGPESSQGPSQNAKNGTESSTTTDTSTGAQDARRNADQNHTNGAAIRTGLTRRR